MLVGFVSPAAFGRSSLPCTQERPSPERAVQGASWVGLPTPSISLDLPARLEPVRLAHGQHLFERGDELERAREARGVYLPLSSVIDALREDARAAQKNLVLLPGAPPLLAQGDPQAIEGARARLNELEEAARGLEIELVAWLVPAAGAASTHPARSDLERAVKGLAPLGRANVRSGELVVLGRRSEQTFLGDWSSEVAASSGVAEPRLLRAVLGESLRLTAARVDHGTRVQLEGWLDLSELGDVETLQPSTPDLGVVQQPSVRSLQVAFSGSMESGGILALSIRGSALAQPDWSVWIEARTAPDVQGGAWRLIDVAALEDGPLALPLPLPGAGLESLAFADASPAVAFEPLPAATLASLGEEARSPADRRRAPIAWGRGVLLVPRADLAAQAAIDGILSAAIGVRSAEVQWSTQCGSFSALVPVAAGRSARVMTGTERTLLTGYDVELAAESWMPSPRVERVFDGIAAQGSFAGSRFSGFAWTSSSEITGTLSREEARLGRMQLLKRSFRGERAALGLGEATLVLSAAGEGSPALEMRLTAH